MKQPGHRPGTTRSSSWRRARSNAYEIKKANCPKCSHVAVAALDGLADDRCRDLIRDLDVPDFAFALRDEIGEQLRDYRHIANLVAAQAEAARDVLERG